MNELEQRLTAAESALKKLNACGYLVTLPQILLFVFLGGCAGLIIGMVFAP